MSNHLNYVSLSYSQLFPKLCVLTWYQRFVLLHMKVQSFVSVSDFIGKVHMCLIYHTCLLPCCFFFSKHPFVITEEKQHDK
jgi:hypothetical protein